PTQINHRADILHHHKQNHRADILHHHKQNHRADILLHHKQNYRADITRHHKQTIGWASTVTINKPSGGYRPSPQTSHRGETARHHKHFRRVGFAHQHATPWHVIG